MHEIRTHLQPGSDVCAKVEQGGLRKGSRVAPVLAASGESFKTAIKPNTVDPDWDPDGGEDNAFVVRVPVEPAGGAEGDDALDASVTVKLFDIDSTRGET